MMKENSESAALPEEYLTRMRQMLGVEWNDYLASLSQDPVSSLRFNTRKWSISDAQTRFPELTETVPWVPEGRYVPDGLRPAKHPAYFAGLYYIQEASAMTPGSLLPLRPGGRVLDLCAAPGGKSTQIAARMKDGVLYANDISTSRAQALLKNLEMAGIPDVFVTAEKPEKLAEEFPGYFDSILVDAPCSGEGMTRRDSAIWKDWCSRGPSWYQPLQAAILDQAAAMAAPGAFLLYSTCTFSEEENEGNIRVFLEKHPEFSLIPVLKNGCSGALPTEAAETGKGNLLPYAYYGGFSEGFLPGTVRLWPHKIRGEGHFLALMRKDGAPDRTDGRNGESGRILSSVLSGDSISAEKPRTGRRGKKKDQRSGSLGQDNSGADRIPDISHIRFPWDRYRLTERDGKCYAVPVGETIRHGIHYLRTGLFLGEAKKNGFQPSQALAMVLEKDCCPDTVSFAWEDDRAVRYLKGETVDLSGGLFPAEIRGGEGRVLICLESWPLGWAVRSGTRLKNQYPPGWRWV